MATIRITENTSIKQRFLLRDSGNTPLNLIGVLTLRFFRRNTQVLEKTLTLGDPKFYVVGDPADGLVELLLTNGMLPVNSYTTIFRYVFDDDEAWEVAGPDVGVTPST